ncbi:MAG TPA: TonB-dependent receptor [Steroidobacteraceae bacterium]|jgi:outer membrane receptor protein involved in Fe transport|nr:TonB-dependent receptor [Steroidobacteraceae bacterium]
MRTTLVSQAVRAALLLACGAAGSAMGQDAAPPAVPQAPATTTKSSAASSTGSTGTASTGLLEEVEVSAQRLQLIGKSSTASQGVVTAQEVNLTPAFRPGQVLETVPGLDVTTHSGEGKANQYLMRGYNLDHGTDLALFVDNMPVNEPTHAHGDGYADINFLMPQLATGETYTKGTYYANIGDFGSVGSIHIGYVDTIPTQVSVGVGTLDYQHYFAAGSTAIGNGNLLGAFEFQHYDGDTTIPGDQVKYNGVVRWSSGDTDKGYSLTAMDYHDTWNSQTDTPYQAIAEGIVSSKWDEMDPSDGGYAHRTSLSWDFHDNLGNGQVLANAYVIGNHLTLWNNFTHYLVDPVNGDQEQQHEDRETVGADVSYGWTQQFGSIANDWLVGGHTRDDYNHVLRIPTQDRNPLSEAQLASVDYPDFYSENDEVRLTEFAGYVQATTHWTDAFRTVLAFREDAMYGTDTGTWSGSASRALPEPKASLIYRFSPDTEAYASYGIGFHSDDLRGVNQAKNEGIAGAPLLASQTGEELGLRQDLLNHKIALTLALFTLQAQSETTYDPDIGQDSAGPGSHREGYEINVTYQATRHIEIYGSYSGDRARYTTQYNDGSGHEGTYLPNAPVGTGEFSVYMTNLGPWSGSLEYRYLGKYPLTSGPCKSDAVATDFGAGFSCANAPMYNNTQGTVWAAGYGEWSGDVDYAFGHGVSASLGVYNILNTHANTMEYYYVYGLNDGSGPEAGRTFHPLEPISTRLTLTKTF